MKVKSLLLTLAFLMSVSLFALHFDRGARKIEISSAVQAAPVVEIVVPEGNPVRNFAATELQKYLNLATSVKPAVVSTPSGKGVALILGDNALAAKAGLKSADLVSEAFIIKRNGNQIFLLGADDSAADPLVNRWKMWFKRGTLTAVYDFLERFAGVRFYFPGQYGTVVPKIKTFALPEKIDILDRPDLVTRENYSGNNSIWYEKPSTYYGNLNGGNLAFLQQRFSDTAIPYGHGLAYLNLIERFAKTHPEYFAMMPNGKRYCTPDLQHPGHLCYSSGIKEIIYQHVKDYLTGKPAPEGLKNWSTNFGRGKFVSVMPQDWLYWCCCPQCAKIARGERFYQYGPEAERKKDAQAISNFLWKTTAEYANRLKTDKIDGVITQMAYGALDLIPECDLPDNIAIQLAVKGMGSPKYWDDDAKLIQKWCAKTKGEISLWTYPGKHMSKAEMKGIPAMMHRQTGLYLQRMGKYIYGTFLESETDYEIFNYLNYYTYAKVSWNLDTDIDKLLDEHYTLMYGKGAQEMKKFFDELENLWCKKIIGNIIDSPLGPVAKLPNDFEVWTKIYSPAKLKEFNTLFDKAEKAAGADKDTLSRIRFMRKAMLGPILEAAKRFAANRESLNDWSITLPAKFGLRPFKSEVGEVATTVEVKETPDAFTFAFDCEEPRMKEIKQEFIKRDGEIYNDSCVEILLNPSGDRKNYLHLIANTAGALFDGAWVLHGKPDMKWDSKADVKAEKRADGFKISVTLPKVSLGNYAKAGFPVNFARHRSLKGKQPQEIYYQWSPDGGRSFHSIEQWGMMNLVPKQEGNLLKDGDFTVEKPRLPFYIGKWSAWNSEGYKKTHWIELDNKVFLTGTSSLHFINKNGSRMSAGQKFKGMKPNTKYRFTYFIRTKDLKGRDGAGGYLSVGTMQMACPNIRILGTTGWHKRSFEFTTPKNITPETEGIVGLWIWNAQGEAWYDHISIQESK